MALRHSATRSQRRGNVVPDAAGPSRRRGPRASSSTMPVSLGHRHPAGEAVSPGSDPRFDPSFRPAGLTGWRWPATVTDERAAPNSILDGPSNGSVVTLILLHARVDQGECARGVGPRREQQAAAGETPRLARAEGHGGTQPARQDRAVTARSFSVRTATASAGRVGWCPERGDDSRAPYRCFPPGVHCNVALPRVRSSGE